MTEAEFCRLACEHLRSLGYEVLEEVRLKAGYVDLLVRQNGEDLALIEAKLHRRDLARAIGQLALYGPSSPHAMRIVLLPAGPRNDFVEKRCQRAGVRLWAFDPKEPNDPFTVSVPAALACGCVPGVSFCTDAERAWIAVGLAHTRGDLYGYARAIRHFGEHLVATEMVA